MKEEEYKKLFKLSKKYLISFIITLFLSVVLFYMANILTTKEKPIPTDYHYLIGNNKEEEGDYVLNYFRIMTRVPFGTILYSLLTLERGMFTHPWEPLYL